MEESAPERLPGCSFGLLNAGKTLDELLAERRAYEDELERLRYRLKKLYNVEHAGMINIEGPLDLNTDYGRLILLGGVHTPRKEKLSIVQRIIIAQALYQRTELKTLIELMSESQSALTKRKAECSISDLESRTSTYCLPSSCEPGAEPYDEAAPSATVAELPISPQRIAYRLPAIVQRLAQQEEDGECTDDEEPPMPAPIARDCSVAMEPAPVQQHDCDLPAESISSTLATTTELAPQPLASSNLSTQSAAPLGEHGNLTGSPADAPPLLKSAPHGFMHPQKPTSLLAATMEYDGTVDSESEDRMRRQMLCRVITTFCPLLARNPTDITFAELMALPRQWEVDLFHLRHRTSFPTHSRIRHLMPKFDVQNELALIVLFGMRFLPAGQHISQPEKEVVEAVQLLGKCCLVWSGLLHGGTESLADLVAPRSGPPPAAGTVNVGDADGAGLVEEAREESSSPVMEESELLDDLDPHGAQLPQSGTQVGKFVTAAAEMDRSEEPVSAQPQVAPESICLPGAAAVQELDDDDDIPFYPDIMAAAMF
jgi:hypothetical protein